MTVQFRVRIEGETHRIRIDLPDDQDPLMLRDLESFAVRTAQLEHSGYIPRGVVSIVDAIPAPPPLRRRASRGPGRTPRPE